MREILLGNAGDFAQALEDWIIDNKCNPKTQEEWERCLKDIAASGKLTSLGAVVDEDVSKLKKDLSNNFNVENL